MSSLASRLQAHSSQCVGRYIIIFMGLLQLVTWILIVLHQTGHQQAREPEKPPAEAETVGEPQRRQLRSHHKTAKRRTPVAHIPILSSIPQTQQMKPTMVHWNPEHSSSVLFHFDYRNGSILVQKRGLYYVYVKTCFRHYDVQDSGSSSSSGSQRPGAGRSPEQLMQYIYLKQASGGQRLIMKSGSTQRWKAMEYDMYCQQQGGAVELRVNDSLFVQVTNSQMLDPEPEGSHFGAFRISP